jgi:hypothetical protein
MLLRKLRGLIKAPPDLSTFPSLSISTSYFYFIFLLHISTSYFYLIFPLRISTSISLFVIRYSIERDPWAFCPIKISCFAKFFTPVFLRLSRKGRDVAPKTPGTIKAPPDLSSFPSLSISTSYFYFIFPLHISASYFYFYFLVRYSIFNRKSPLGDLGAERAFFIIFSYSHCQDEQGLFEYAGIYFMLGKDKTGQLIFA